MFSVGWCVGLESEPPERGVSGVKEGMEELSSTEEGVVWLESRVPESVEGLAAERGVGTDAVVLATGGTTGDAMSVTGGTTGGVAGGMTDGATGGTTGDTTDGATGGTTDGAAGGMTDVAACVTDGTTEGAAGVTDGTTESAVGGATLRDSREGEVGGGERGDS